MIRVEIIDDSEGFLQVTFYYPVPVNLYNPESLDNTRIAAGKTLSHA